MATFVSDLWESIFTPGVTPVLLKATYGAFIMLISVLSILLFFTRNIHVLVLLILSCCLVGSLMWFLQELEAAKAAGKLPRKDTVSNDKSTNQVKESKKAL